MFEDYTQQIKVVNLLVQEKKEDLKLLEKRNAQVKDINDFYKKDTERIKQINTLIQYMQKLKTENNVSAGSKQINELAQRIQELKTESNIARIKQINKFVQYIQELKVENNKLKQRIQNLEVENNKLKEKDDI